MNWTEVLQGLNTFANAPLFTIAGTEVTAASVVTFFLILLVTFWVSRLLQRVAEGWLRVRGVLEEGTVSTTKRLLHYAVILVGLGIAIETIGIHLGALFAAGAVVAVALGFAMQNILQNFVSGVILLAERTITEGDILEVDGRIVRVQRMGTRATVARTRDEEEIIIPNSLLVQASVTNYTLGDSLYRIRARVGVAYGSEMDRVVEVLRAAGESVPDRVKEKDPIILLLEFGNSSVDFEVSVWAEDPWAARVTRSALNFAIWHHLKAAGITIAFPQLDVHFDESVRGARPPSGEAPPSPSDSSP
jgi:small-conductance mechanosensitive channel